MRKCFLSILFIIAISFAYSQNIEISGNGVLIAGDGSNIPNNIDGTDFEKVAIGNNLMHSFTILNIENRGRIKIKRITASSTEFLITNKPRDLKKNKSGTFDVIFRPTTEGFQAAIISIFVEAGRRKKTYTFNVSGTATEGFIISDIMITQYYENGLDNDYIEIKNITNFTISRKEYYLAHYKSNDDTNKAPKKRNSIEIKSMRPGEVRIYSKFKLEGNDIVVISKSKGRNCFSDRVDLIGSQGVFWGKIKSFTKGGCASEITHLNFELNDWIEIAVAKVDAADNRQNIALGTYNLGSILWNGSTWSDSALPDLSRIAVIDGIYTAGVGNIESCDLIINSDLNFDSKTTNSVIVYRDLTINGTFTIGDQESLVMYDDNAVISGNIIKKESSTYRNNAYDFTYWSSPILNASIGSVFAGVSSSRIFLYDQSQTNTSDPLHQDFWNTWVLASGNMDMGKGYAAEGITGTTGIHNISFTGKPNNGVLIVDMFAWSDSNPDNDFNLIGNPYPSSIDIELFFDENIVIIDPTIYLWTHNTPISNGNSGDFAFDDYVTYNYTGGTGTGAGPVPDKNIGSSQGFFIRATNSGSVVFNNSMRLENANDQFFKSNNINKKKEEVVVKQKDRLWLNLKTDQGGFNQLLIGFMEKATSKVDKGYDALKFKSSNVISFYSIIENEKFAIQGLEPFSTDKTVALGIDTKVAPRNFSISIFKKEGILKEIDIYLVDNLLNTTHNLSHSDYQFYQIEEGEFIDRFVLQFDNSVLKVDHFIGQNEFEIINSENGFIVSSNYTVEKITMYDILGRELIKAKPKEQYFFIQNKNIKKGSLIIIQVELENGALISKKIIKY